MTGFVHSNSMFATYYQLCNSLHITGDGDDDDYANIYNKNRASESLQLCKFGTFSKKFEHIYAHIHIHCNILLDMQFPTYYGR